MTPFQLHKERWKGGCGSSCCPGARVVFFRGKIPSDITFCGQSPGKTENTTGLPFVGRAGQLLDDIVQAGVRSSLRVSFCNVVGCRPLDEDGEYTDEPQEEQILACKERLEEFLCLARPRLLIAVGRIAHDHLEPGYRWSTELPPGLQKIIDIVHPSSILRANSNAQQTLMKNKAVIAVRNAVEEVFGETED